ncbi:UNKNOWN [Stylonychia lemnae]|uniref:Uncharacterized protein n=1 Tax=Stylonychia lemnae TaxID=5949 RepID=A0A078AXD4_STYLE|nr:UNKNOWN [Stylonychia lemnae]|eukprot:CDW87125.1 UNKNOWN [Stylonychia lemnae]
MYKCFLYGHFEDLISSEGLSVALMNLESQLGSWRCLVRCVSTGQVRLPNELVSLPPLVPLEGLRNPLSQVCTLIIHVSPCLSPHVDAVVGISSAGQQLWVLSPLASLRWLGF